MKRFLLFPVVSVAFACVSDGAPKTDFNVDDNGGGVAKADEAISRKEFCMIP